jgi:uncharacterized protein YhaN
VDELIKKLVHEEVTKQMHALSKSVDEVQKQNDGQSKLLAMQVARIDTVDRWTKKLWSNGSGGPPGYLEIARKEDKERLERQERLADKRFEELAEMIGKLEADRLRKEAVDKAEAEKLADTQKTHRWTRAHLILVIAGSFGGTWFLHLILPLVKALVDHAVQALK